MTMKNVLGIDLHARTLLVCCPKSRKREVRGVFLINFGSLKLIDSPHPLSNKHPEASEQTED